LSAVILLSPIILNLLKKCFGFVIYFPYIYGMKDTADIKLTYEELLAEHTGLKCEHTELKCEHAGLKSKHVELKCEHTGLKSEHTGLKCKLDALNAEYEALKTKNITMELELENLRRLVFGQKSERYVPLEAPDQLKLDLGSDQPVKEVVEQTEKVSYERRKTKKNYTPHTRRPFPEHLVREEIIVEPDEDVTDCKKIGEEITEELEYEPGKLYVKKYIRPKYARPRDEGVVIAELPSRPIERGLAGPGLLAHVLISKCVDHLPLYRQHKQFLRQDVFLAVSTLSDWVKSCYNLLNPLYEQLRQQLISSSYLMADETPIRVLDRAKKGKTHLGYMWGFYSPILRQVCFVYHEGRDRAAPNSMFAQFDGYLQTDGYAGYHEIVKNNQLTSVGCFAHARRKFVEAQKNDPTRADEMLTYIKQLYKIERQAREQGLDRDGRFELREESALPVLDSIKSWLDVNCKQVLPESAIGKAITYMLNQWSRLERYTENGFLEIDNNLMENQIRPIALGRKNYLFAGSHEGGKRLAMMYSLIGTAKQHNIEPFAYLRDILSRIADHPYSKIIELLPPIWTPKNED
jgi:transposase